jgi:outer membrane receptor protein involved in Fe transport
MGAIETEVPASITQFDASTIQAIGAQNISDLARVTPNVQIVQPGATQATFYVRGIGLQSFDANATGAVTIFQDDVALDLPAIQTGQLFDVQNVDIVRGPQGTGPFRNASGGAIAVSSNLPTGNYGAQIRASLGEYRADGGKGAHHGVIQDYEGYLEAPIVPEALSSRFAFRLRDAEPYQTNGCGNAFPSRNARSAREPSPSSSTATSAASAARRCGRSSESPTSRRACPPRSTQGQLGGARDLAVQADNSDLDVVLNGHGSMLDEDQTYGQVIGTKGVPSRGFFFGSERRESRLLGARPARRSSSRSADAGTLALRARAGRAGTARLPSSDFERLDAEKRPLDRSRTAATTTATASRSAIPGARSSSARRSSATSRCSRSPPTTATSASAIRTPTSRPTCCSRSSRTTTRGRPGSSCTSGASSRASRCSGRSAATTSRRSLDSTSTTQLADTTASSAPSARRRELRHLGQVHVGLPRRRARSRAACAGTGSTRISRSRASCSDRAGGGPPARASPDETWQTPTGNLILTYHFNNEVSAFAKYSRGFKAGHFNALASENVNRPPADPEYNDAWEAGSRARGLESPPVGLAQLLLLHVQDYQIFLFRSVADEPPVLEIINAPRPRTTASSSRGARMPLRGWRRAMIENLMLTANVGWLHGEFLDFQIRSDADDRQRGRFRPRSTSRAISCRTRPSTRCRGSRPGRSTSGAGAT